MAKIKFVRLLTIWAAVLTAALVIVPGAGALPLPWSLADPNPGFVNTNYDGLDVGVAIGARSSDFGGVGNLTTTVYQKGDVFTYEYALSPGVANFLEFNTALPFEGIVDGLLFGYSFEDALQALPDRVAYQENVPDAYGNPRDGSELFKIEQDADGTLDFMLFTPFLDYVATEQIDYWADGDHTIRFFAQSLLGPGAEGRYNLNARPGISNTINLMPGQTPIPEPATLALVGFGLIGIGVGARRKIKTK